MQSGDLATKPLKLSGLKEPAKQEKKQSVLLSTLSREEKHISIFLKLSNRVLTGENMILKFV